MGLLEKLWDDTVAGPRPDSGLGKLRKYNTFNFRPSSGKELEGGSGRSYGEEAATPVDNQEAVKVTRSIMIVKPPGYNLGAGSAPASPAGSDSPRTPSSPFSGNNRSGAFRFRRNSTSDTYEKAANDNGSRSSLPSQDV